MTTKMPKGDAMFTRRCFFRIGLAVAALAVLLPARAGQEVKPAPPVAPAVPALPSRAPQVPTLPAAPAAPAVTPTRPTRLFNDKDLSGWYTFFPSQGVSKDPEKIITVADGVIRVTGKEFGYFATKEEYTNYHLVFDVKWGETKWPPRLTAVRDSGVLVHAIGPDKVWIKSFECQVQEKDCGDIHHIGGVSSMVDGQRRANRVVKKSDQEKPHGQWNTIEVICDADTVTNIVNGVVVNTATNVCTNRDGTGPALVQGKIAFQSEGAEVFYRNIMIKPLAKKAAGPVTK